MAEEDRIRRVLVMLDEAFGAEARNVAHRATRHLAGLSPIQMAKAPAGDRVVIAELPNLVAQFGQRADQV